MSFLFEVSNNQFIGLDKNISDWFDSKFNTKYKSGNVNAKVNSLILDKSKVDNSEPVDEISDLKEWMVYKNDDLWYSQCFDVRD